MDGVLQLTAIRVVYQGVIPQGSRDKVDKILAARATQCPAYQSVKGCIDVTWRSELTEADG